MTETKTEVVISGIGGVFPECGTVDEFKSLLFNKMNGVTSDERRWIPGQLETPSGVGKIPNPEKFDNIFFGIHRMMADKLDVLTRIGLERSIEAIVDAGISPADLSGTNTAVFMSSCISESELFGIVDEQARGFGLLGNNRAMQANRLSYTLNLNGPSYTIDATWIGGTQALMRAKQMIEDGTINAAIIGSCSLCLNPCLSLQFEGLGRLNNTTETRSYSADANGMNRGEACVTILLQKSSEAKRSYGTVLNVTGVCGETNSSLFRYNENLYKKTLINAYKAIGVDPAKVGFVEGEGSGLKKLDSMELNILSEVFCTPNRTEPLKVGSVKSNVGHCEASSSLVSLVKSLIVLDSGYIPPNINYSEPNPDCPALISGQLEVVTQKTLLKGDIVGVSSFGLCNSFSHVILKQNKKYKTKIYKKGEMFEDGLPRLIFISGRNEKCIEKLKTCLQNIQIDEEFAALLQNVYHKYILAHHFRSFRVLPQTDEETPEKVTYIPAVTKRPIWFIFSGMGSQWNGMGKQLLNIPKFTESVRKSEAILKTKGIDLLSILTSDDPKLFDNILNSFVGIAAIQIGLVDVLKSIDILPDGIIGHSVGELGCAYADGCFTAEQMILAAHARGRASIETQLIDGTMAAIGLGYNDIKNRLPDDIEVACHNASDSSTLSGPTASVTQFVEQLKSEGVFAKVVNVSNIAYHSRYIRPAAPTLLKYLKEVIPESKARSSKWVSSSIPETEWGSELAQKSSPEYHTNNLLGQVLFEEASRHIPEDAIAIEIAPHGLLQAILKRSLPDTVTSIPLTNKNSKDSVRYLLDAIGKMYINGMTPNIEAFYQPVGYPVSRGTHALSSLFFWDHSENWTLSCQSLKKYRVQGERRFYFKLSRERVLADYKVYGRNILPSSLLLIHVWKSFIVQQRELKFDNLIGFEELSIKKNIEITLDETLECYSFIQCGTGRFEVYYNDEVIVSGRVYRPDSINMAELNQKMMYPSTVSHNTPHSSMSKNDLYSLLEHNGYELGEHFKTVTNIDLYFEEYRGNVKWNNDWMSFLNGVFTLLIYKSMENNDSPADVANIRQLCIDPSKFENSVGKDIPIHYSFKTNEIHGDGIYILHPEIKPLSINAFNLFDLRLEEERFIQLNNPNFENEICFINNCVQIVLELKKYQLNPKWENFKIYYNCGDEEMSQYISLVKHMFDIQIGIGITVANLDNINLEKISNKEHNIVLVSKDQINNVISVFKNTKYVHLLVLSDEVLSSTENWSVILQQKFNEKHLVLIKKILEKKVISLKIDDFTNLQNIHDNIGISLKECKKTKSYLYIFAKAVSYVKVSKFMEYILSKNKSKSIRFVFVFDKTCPEFNSAHTFYVEHLHKHLFVNIYKDGEWGIFVRNIVESSNFITLVDNKYTPPINSITLDGLKVKYLGINFQDVSVNHVTDNELGHLEYSGVTVDGKSVMGIAPFGINTLTTISPDPHLSWVIPLDWSLEDAATVPFSYSLAYYILNILASNILIEKSILVNAGINTVGQAVISIALASGFTVYATVENEEQAKLLRKKFPLLSESRIFNYKSVNFEILLKIATKGKGVSIVLNCLSGNEFHASLRTIATYGKFFQLTKFDMKNKEKMGLNAFLGVIAFYGVSPNRLLEECSDIKLKVQKEVQKGIELGIVKPFDRHVLTGPCTGEQAIKALNSSSQGIDSKRIVLQLEGENILRESLQDSKYKRYQCYSNKVYLIVGSKYSTWIDLAEWLVLRGARKIVVAIKKYAISTTASRRFNLLMARNQTVMMQIVSDSNFDTKKSLIQLLHDITAATTLGGIFFTTMDDEGNKLQNIQYALEHLPSLRHENDLFIVCIMSGGNDICAELRAKGVCQNVISISWNVTTTEPKFCNLLPLLDKVFTSFNKISSSTIICTELNKELMAIRDNYSKIIAQLPESTDELNAFGDLVSGEPVFVEVDTKSPRYADTLEGLPLFVVAGFRPEKVKPLYANLLCPTFEARLPETIESIDQVATQLVQKLKMITNHLTVSLIGVSWGGAVCILMAQILEAENIAVSLTLIEGIPDVIQEWASSLKQYGSINSKLVSNYFLFNHAIAQELATKNGWNTELPKILSSNGVLAADKTLKALNAISSRLNAIFTLKPFTNKIIAKVKVINMETKLTNLNVQNLADYCVWEPKIYTLDENSYKQMLSGKKIAQIVHKNIMHYYPDSMDISITNMYACSTRNTVGIVLK